MWSNFKNKIIGRVLDKWITEADNESTSENEFLNLKNVRINTENLNLKLKNVLKGLFTIKSGTMNELAVEINWTEIFRYWTEIQARYQNEDDDYDNYRCDNRKSESTNANNNSKNSFIKIKNFTIELELKANEDIMTIIDEFEKYIEEFTEEIFKEFTEEIFKELLESPEIIDVDLMADFIKHIIGQFKVEIEGISVNITNQSQAQWKLFVPHLMIHPESNGIRRIFVIEEDIKVLGAKFELKIQKGTEFHIFRTIEALKIKVKIPEIEFKTECHDLESLCSLWTEFFQCATIPKSFSKTETANNYSLLLFFELVVDVFRIKIGKLNFIAHDLMMMEETGNFIVGHFQVRWDGNLILDSPVQTHCITGNFKEFLVCVEELSSVKVDFQQITDLIDFFTFKSKFENKQLQSGELYNINIRSLQLLLEDYLTGLQLNFEGLYIRSKFLRLNSVQVKYSQSEIVLHDISYTKSELEMNTCVDYKSPFSDLIRYIENDQMISLQDQKELYSHYETRLDSLNIRNLSGEIHVKDTEMMSEALKTRTDKFGESSSVMELMGRVESINLKVNLDNSINYFIALKNLNFLKTNQILDFRCEALESLQRNSVGIIKTGQISFTLAEGLNVMNVERIIFTVPHDLHELVKEDLDVFDYKKIFSFDPLETSSKNNNFHFQLTLKNIKLSLLPPESLSLNNPPIHSLVIIKEINVKLIEDFIVYLDEGELILNNESILKSGLLKFNRNGSETLEVRNHCTVMNLNSIDLKNLLEFFSFWSEIYSPVISPIEPKAVFHNETSVDLDLNVNILENQNSTKETSVTSVNINENGSENEDDDNNLQLEFEFSDDSDCDDDDKSHENENFVESETTTTTTSQALKDLLNEVDDKFFVSKIENYSKINNGIKITNFRFEVNLIVDSSENILSKSKTGSIDKDPERITLNLGGINGFVSSELIDLKVKDGNIEKFKTRTEIKSSKKTLLNKWNRGPDLTSKYPIEDGNFASIRAEKMVKSKRESESHGIDEFNLNLTICPLRLFLDQKSLSTLREFFNQSPENVIAANNNNNYNYNNSKEKEIRSFIFFNKVNISSLALKLDYKPNSLDGAIPLEGAEVILPRVELRGVKGFEGLGPAIMNAWIPELRGKKLTGVFTSGLVPVRTIINLGGGVVELILLPWQSSRSAARTAANLRQSSKKIGLETLKLTATLAHQTTKLLSSGSADPDSFPRYPPDFQSGLQQAAQLIIALPTKISDRKRGKSAVRAVPLVILDSAGVVSGALAKTLQGLQAHFDRELNNDRKIKRNG